MHTKTLLEDVVDKGLDKLEEMEMGTKEHSTAVDDVVKLLDRKIELDRLAADEIQKEKQLLEERNARRLKIGTDVGLGLLGMGMTFVGIVLTFTFEEKGSICSKVGTKMLDRILRSKS